MNIKFISMNIGGTEQVASAIERLEALLASYGCGETVVCTQASKLVGSLSAAFSRAEMVVVGIEPARYCRTKQALLHAMHIKTQINSDINEKIKEAFPDMQGEELASQASMPVGAKLFIPSDGLYSGFAIKSGKQHFVMLPLSVKLIDTMTANGLLPLFDELGIKPIEKKPVEAPPADPVIEDIKPDNTVPEQADEDDDAAEVSESLLNWVRKSTNSLVGSGLKLYFAKTPSAEMLVDLCPQEETSPYVFTEYTAERNGETPKDYTADLARYAIADTENGIGAAISNIFTSSANAEGEKKYNIYIAVADVSTARVLRLASEPGESPEDLVYVAAEKLFEMIFDKCVIGIKSPDEVDSTPTPEQLERLNELGVKKKRRRAVRILIYCLLAIIITLFVYFTVDGVRAAQSEKQTAEVTFAQYAAAMTLSDEGEIIAINSDDFEIVVNEEDWYSTPSDEGEEELPATDAPTAVETATAAESATTAAKNTTAEKLTTLKTTLDANKTTVATTVKKTTTTKKPTTAATTKKTTTTTRKSIADYFTTVSTALTTILPSGGGSGNVSGRFIITTYGYGHGVGMSQEGARGYSKQGWSYTQILKHYFPGTNVVRDAQEKIPLTVTFGGRDYSLKEYLCCTVVAEIGGGTADTLEALKAQAVSAYTYAKRNGFSISSTQHAFKTGWSYEGTLVESAVSAVMGDYVDYKGSPANTTYYAMSAGKTANVTTVWSGSTNSYPYLAGGVVSDPDKSCAKYKVESSFSAAEMKELMKKNIGVELSGDPAKWFAIISHDSAVNSKIGYVTKMSVGGKTISGAAFRNTAMQYKIRSHCFTIEYVK